MYLGCARAMRSRACSVRPSISVPLPARGRTHEPSTFVQWGSALRTVRVAVRPRNRGARRLAARGSQQLVARLQVLMLLADPASPTGAV